MWDDGAAASAGHNAIMQRDETRRHDTGAQVRGRGRRDAAGRLAVDAGVQVQWDVEAASQPGAADEGQTRFKERRSHCEARQQGVWISGADE